jgi:hypothetical protein
MAPSGACGLALAGAVLGFVLALGPSAAAHAAAPAPASGAAMSADEVILQFKRADLKAALRRAPEEVSARETVRRALSALAQRHGVALHYQQTLGVGSALVAVTPATAELDALVARLAADAEVESVEVNARMTHFKPGPR